MFQYAAAKAVAKSNPIYFDLSWMKKNSASNENFTARSFALDIFPEIKKKFINRWASSVLNGQYRSHRLLKRIIFPGLVNVYDNGINQFLDNQNSAGSFYMDGYFQVEKLFKDQRTVLLEDFKFPGFSRQSQYWSEKIRSAANPVSIHVRRGDYLKPNYQSFHGILPLSWYLAAIDKLENSLNGITYFIFSEDKEWCREAFAFLGPRGVLVDTRDDEPWADMALMSRCHHHIIANSSFSWWAAWLNTFPDKIAIAPKNWYNDYLMNEQTFAMMPEEWIRI